MKDRTRQILAALIRDFISEGTPVASKKLLQSGDFSVSSATIRNEFAVLEEVGLISSPHVSSGKVPTEAGYRYYVDQLMTSEEQRVEAFQVELKDRLKEYQLSRVKDTLFDSLQMLSSISGNVAFACVEEDFTTYLGLGNVLRSPEFSADPTKAAEVVEVLEGRDRFVNFMKNVEVPVGEVKIFIGEQDLIEGLHSCSLLLTRFSAKGSDGWLGILGPMRMRYGYNKVLLKNVAEML